MKPFLLFFLLSIAVPALAEIEISSIFCQVDYYYSGPFSVTRYRVQRVEKGKNIKERYNGIPTSWSTFTNYKTLEDGFKTRHDAIEAKLVYQENGDCN